MTYLDLVNEVLTRLRESQVGTVQGNYPLLIGSFVNRAKEWAERKNDWQCLREEITVNTAQGTPNYPVAGTNNKTRLYYEWDDTVGVHRPIVFCTTTGSRGQLTQKNLRYYTNARKATETITQGKPSIYVVLNRDPDSNEMQLGLVDEPDGVYDIDLTVIQPEPKLSADDDETALPEEVIVQYAYALAISERGEDGGASFDEEMQKAQQTLAEFEQADSSWADYELVMRAE